MCSLLSALLYRSLKHQVRGYDRKCPSLWRFWFWQHLVAWDRNLTLRSSSFIAEIGNMSASKALYMSMSTVLSFDIDGNQTSGWITTALLMHLTTHLIQAIRLSTNWSTRGHYVHHLQSIISTSPSKFWDECYALISYHSIWLSLAGIDINDPEERKKIDKKVESKVKGISFLGVIEQLI